MTELNSLKDLLYSRKNERSKGITFIESREKEVFFSYKELYDNAVYRLHNMHLSGIKLGDKVIMELDSNQEFLINFWAGILGGIIPIPCMLGMNIEDQNKLLEIYKVSDNPKIILNQKKAENFLNFLENLEESEEKLIDSIVYNESLNLKIQQAVTAEVNVNDIAFIQFSSGSTGKPKGVILTHENLLVNLADSTGAAETTEQDSSINWMPLTHDLGLIKIHIGSLFCNLNQFIMSPQLYLKRPTLLFDKSHKHKITQLYLTNYGMKLFLNAYEKIEMPVWDLEHVRFILNAAEPISYELCLTFIKMMANHNLDENVLMPAYGLAEGTVGVTSHKVRSPLKAYSLDRSSLSVGRKILESDNENAVSFVEIGEPVKHTSVRIVDQNNVELEDKTIGYIQMKGKNVTQGYLNNEEETQQIFAEDGWVKTGDLGFKNNNKITITGRYKDLIILNGKNYYPHDIERVGARTINLGEDKVAVCGVYNEERFREELIVFIVFKKSLNEFYPWIDEVKKGISKNIGLEVKRVLPVKHIPKTSSGKARRFKLKEDYANNLFRDLEEKIFEIKQESLCVSPISDSEMNLLGLWREVLENPAIEMNDSFLASGGDSLKSIQLVEEVNSVFELELDPEQLLDELSTPLLMMQYISNKTHQPN